MVGNPPTDVKAGAVELHVCVLDTKREKNWCCYIAEKTFIILFCRWKV